MMGRRTHDMLTTTLPPTLCCGDYWRTHASMDEDWRWLACAPNGIIGGVTVVELHRDGSITTQEREFVGGRGAWTGLIVEGSWERTG